MTPFPQSACTAKISVQDRSGACLVAQVSSVFALYFFLFVEEKSWFTNIVSWLTIWKNVNWLSQHLCYLWVHSKLCWHCKTQMQLVLLAVQMNVRSKLEKKMWCWRTPACVWFLIHQLVWWKWWKIKDLVLRFKITWFFVLFFVCCLDSLFMLCCVVFQTSVVQRFAQYISNDGTPVWSNAYISVFKSSNPEPIQLSNQVAAKLTFGGGDPANDQVQQVTQTFSKSLSQFGCKPEKVLWGNIVQSCWTQKLLWTVITERL